MLKKYYIKGNLRPNDFTRAVITDTSPFETPIIFSNDGFYKNYVRRDRLSIGVLDLITAITSSKKYTIPYRYNIVKSSESFRQLSLLHPASQIAICEFYSRYQDLICYYAGQSPFSMRAPIKVGSSFYFATSKSEINKYKKGTVDTVDIDRVARNPASYFSYKGYNRLYKFFNSSDFLSLEKKYGFMTSFDVAKCFDSIYTHSLAWAVKDIHTAKESTTSSHFGGDFDSLMQRMNYNETNGICIGAEVSRIFAEIIFAKIDTNLVKKLNEQKIVIQTDYDIRRYVDNYYVFTNSPEIGRKIQKCLDVSLKEYKFHINEQKIEKFQRPFYTTKSKVTDEANRMLNDFFASFTGKKVKNGVHYTYPLPIYKYSSLLQSFVREVKTCCGNNHSGYELSNNYLISALIRTLIELSDDFEELSDDSSIERDDYIHSILLLVELSFFLYTMNPTVASSLTLASGIVTAGKFFELNHNDRLPFLQDNIVRWTVQLMHDPRFDTLVRNHDAIPIEVLNILIAMHAIATDHLFGEPVFREIFPEIRKLQYFSIITCLFVIRNDVRFGKLKGEIFSRIMEIISSSRGLNLVSHDAHLALDSIACPYLSLQDRRKLLKKVRSLLSLPALTNIQIDELVIEFEKNAWFVNWQGVDLLNMITKKQLSVVY